VYASVQYEVMGDAGRGPVVALVMCVLSCACLYLLRALCLLCVYGVSDVGCGNSGMTCVSVRCGVTGSVWASARTG
jgi:hypothetical protein